MNVKHKQSDDQGLNRKFEAVGIVRGRINEIDSPERENDKKDG